MSALYSSKMKSESIYKFISYLHSSTCLKNISILIMIVEYIYWLFKNF